MAGNAYQSVVKTIRIPTGWVDEPSPAAGASPGIYAAAGFDRDDVAGPKSNASILKSTLCDDRLIDPARRDRVARIVLARGGRILLARNRERGISQRDKKNQRCPASCKHAMS